jgi:flagellar biosynthesis protein FlhB
MRPYQNPHGEVGYGNSVEPGAMKLLNMNSTSMMELIGIREALELLLVGVLLMFVVERSEEDMIEREATTLVDVTLTHMSQLLLIMVMSLMTMMVLLRS